MQLWRSNAQFPHICDSASDRPKKREMKPVFDKLSLLKKTKAHAAIITLRRSVSINTKGVNKSIFSVGWRGYRKNYQKANVPHNHVHSISKRKVTRSFILRSCYKVFYLGRCSPVVSGGMRLVLEAPNMWVWCFFGCSVPVVPRATRTTLGNHRIRDQTWGLHIQDMQPSPSKYLSSLEIFHLLLFQML